MDNGKNEILLKKIMVYGIVQGVGFRPLVYRIAHNHNIKGTVKNIGGLVEIIAQGSLQSIHDFMEDMKRQGEENCDIVQISMDDLHDSPITGKISNGERPPFDDFCIIASTSDTEAAMIPPDLPVCPKCQKELDTKTDRRYLHPFISCTACGPRYTIMERLPYDRENTVMNDFNLCPSCYQEYRSPNSRRFHAQTISCHECGPYLIYNNRRNIEALDAAISCIKNGGILAVKGIGGYHYTCSPFLEETVQQLRKLKGREEKPFAVMFPSLESVKEYCYLSEEEENLINSKAKPIVLLYYKDHHSMAVSTNKNSIYCGAFLPYTPIQIMLTKSCGPLIMTSANLSGKPIIKEDEKMLAVISTSLGGVLYHKRRIVRSVDDSVAKIVDHKPQLIRRSRGYVPFPVFLPQEEKDIQILAAGGDLKSAFALYRNGKAVVSQYFGDLGDSEILEEYRNSITDLEELLVINPVLAVCDLHPNYFSTNYIKSLYIPYLAVQHHHAHIASVMAEHSIKEKVIGVAFDGTGYGMDGNIWGGEFLLCEGADFIRAAHLAYTPIIGGDQSMRDAKKTAACFLIEANLSEYIYDDRKEIIEAAVRNHINTVLSSSMGRLFDAISSILGIRDYNDYEGECGSDLEKEAVIAKKNGVKPQKLRFAIQHKNDKIELDYGPILQSICQLRKNAEKGSLALGFHEAVAEGIQKVCDILGNKYQIDKVALSGGVFQNTLLTEQTLLLLRKSGFQVYVNSSVPPNDGGICLGQTWIGLLKQ